MCVVIAPVVAWTIAAVTAAAAVAEDVSANKAARKQTNILKQQADERAEQLADQASAEMNARAGEIRKATASARASASGAGINLGSGSFLAQMQSFDQQFDDAQGLQTKNLNDSIKANSTQLNVALSQITTKTGLGMGLDAFSTGTRAYSAAGGSFVQKPPPNNT